MSISKRRQEILELLRTATKMSVQELSGAFPNVTPATIRRDLTALEEEGLVMRSYGQVRLFARDRPVLPFSDRLSIGVAEKRRVCERAARLVEPGMSLLLDGGTTTLALAQIVGGKASSVVTNSLEILHRLAGETAELTCSGGSLEPDNMCFSGPAAERFFRDIRVDIAFIGADGVREGGGLTCASPRLYSLKRQMLGCARRRYVILDDSKLTAASLYLFTPFQLLDGLIVNAPVSGSPQSQVLQRLVNDGVRVLVAG